jgi:hypothetical protein
LCLTITSFEIKWHNAYIISYCCWIIGNME